MAELTFPLDVKTLESIPYNKRKTQIVRFSRSLGAVERAALLDQLLNNKEAPSATIGVQGSKDKHDDLAGLLGPNTQSSDSSSTYYLQELGLLVAASDWKGDLLVESARLVGNKYISDKALSLCIHSPCVSDDQVRSLFIESNERYKFKVLRACEREPLRQAFLTEIVDDWLKETPERQLIAYELLHAVARGTSWFIPELKSIIERTNRVLYRSSKRTQTGKPEFEQRCYNALRFDLMWEHHRDALLEAIRSDVLSTKTFVQRYLVFRNWDPLLNSDGWSSKYIKTNNQRFNFSVRIPWRDIFYLYAENLPFCPTDSRVLEIMNAKVAGDSSVVDSVKEDLYDKLVQVASWQLDWSNHLRLFTPNWIDSRFLWRELGQEEVLRIICSRQSDGDGIIRKESLSLVTSLLTKMVTRPVHAELAPGFVDLVHAQVEKVLSLVDPTMFYKGVRSLENYDSKQAFDRATAINVTWQAYLRFVNSLLEYQHITIGQQLDLFTVLFRHHKRMLLTPATLQTPLQLVTAQDMKNLLRRYETGLTQFMNAILKSLMKRIQNATERGKSVTRLETVFSKVVEMGYTGIHLDIENLYTQLGAAYPMVFGRSPIADLSREVLPFVHGLSFCRNSIEQNLDVAARSSEQLLTEVYLPFIRRWTIGEDCLFTNQPDHMFADHKPFASDVAVRASAIESMQQVRSKYINSIKFLEKPLFSEAFSSQAVNQYLNYLEDWLNDAATACIQALDAKRLNRHSTRGESSHPTTMPNSEKALQLIAASMTILLSEQTALYVRDEWKDNLQAERVVLIKRAVKNWSAATYYLDGSDPLGADFGGKLNPYTMEPLLRKLLALPPSIAKSYQSLIVELLALRCHGKIAHFDNILLDADQKLYKAYQSPSGECSNFFMNTFGLSTDNSFSSAILEALEAYPVKELRPLGSFFESLASFYDVSKPEARRRLEQNLSKPLFYDRLACIKVLLTATRRTRIISEFEKSLGKVIKAIENESYANRMAAIRTVLTEYNLGLDCLLPSVKGGGSLSDRSYALYLLSPPQEKDWPAIIAASQTVPTAICKLLDDFIASPDEKADDDSKIFRTISDHMVLKALTWPCTLVANPDPRMEQVQRTWFDAAIELQWKLMLWKVGKGQAQTFRPLFSSSTFSSVRNTILEAGYQCDKPYPKGKEETREYVEEAKRRRKAKAIFITDLFRDAYVKRLGEFLPVGAPLGRKAGMEKKRMLDLLSIVQGEWTNCEPLRAKLEDIVEQVKTVDAKAHQLQVLTLMKACTEASVTWGLLCRNSMPKWAKISFRAETLVRPKAVKSNGTGKAKKGRRKLGRGGKNTAPAISGQEETPWCMARYFPFLSPIIPRYWELVLNQFGIHHVEGIAVGKCILRMYLRWRFWNADALPTRAERQTMRVATALELLGMCESAVHIKCVQAALKDFRQDLLDRYIFSKDEKDPLLGKFSDATLKDEDHVSDDEDDDKSETLLSKSVIRPFRPYGVYGWNKLTHNQGRKLAQFLLDDIEKSDASLIDRLSSVAKLQFVPAVNYQDFANVLMTHFDRRAKYHEVLKKFKLEGTEVTAEPPLPKNVVETLFKAILSDQSPSALFTLLQPALMRESTTKTTIMVAERAVVLLTPYQMADLVGRLLARKGKDGLLVGPVKALTRILFNLASSNPQVSGENVIEQAVQLLSNQWARQDLHRDVRLLMIQYALKTLSQPATKSTEAFAWSVLENVASNQAYPDILRGRLYCAIPSHPMFPCVPIAPTSHQEFNILARECKATSNEDSSVVRDNSRYLKIVLKAMETCAARARDCLKKAEEYEKDRRKRGIAKKEANVAANIEAILMMRLNIWVNDTADTYNAVFDRFKTCLMSYSDANVTDEMIPRFGIYSEKVPKLLAELANAAYPFSSKVGVYTDPEVAGKIKEILSPLISGIAGGVPLTKYNLRHAYVLATKSLVENLSREGQKQSLYRKAFLAYKDELALIRRELKLNNSLSSFIPVMQTSGTRDDDEEEA